MKKLLLGSMALTFFAIAISIFQISCQKEAVANTTSSAQLGTILYTINVDLSTVEYWTMNYDGTNAKKIPITFSSGLTYTGFPRLSPDGKTIFFTGVSSSASYLYSCSVDGSNLRTLLSKNIVANIAPISLSDIY